MTKIILAFFIAMLFSLSLIAQPPIDWVQKLHNIDSDYGQSMTVDKNNNTYVLGNSGSNGGGTEGLFIAKRDSANVLWKYSPESIYVYRSKAYEIESDTLGNIYILFELEGTLRFGNDTITSSPGLHLVKMVDQVLLWHIELPYGYSYESISQLETNANGDCYVMSNYKNTEILGNDTITPSGKADIFITKISNNGQFLWTNSFGNSSQYKADVSKGLALDSIENVYGYYARAYSSGNGDGDSYIVKITSSGQLIEQEKITGFDGKNTQIDCFTTSPAGISYISLYLKDTLTTIKDTTLNNTPEDHILVVYDSSLNFLKGVVLEDTSQTNRLDPQVVRVNNSGQVFVGGKSWSQSNSDFFMLRYDSQMTLKWVKYFASDQQSVYHNKFTDIVIDNDSINFICSADGSSVTFDSLSFTNTHFTDVFWGCIIDTIDMNCSNTNANMSTVACNNLTSPSGNYIWYTSGIYMDTIPNSSGCDSIMTFNVTINNVDASVVNNSPTIACNLSGAAYQWLDCNNNYMPMSGDTNQTYTAITNGNYAVEITENGCKDTSVCEAVINIALAEKSFESKLRIFPNPSNGKFTIDLGQMCTNVTVVLRNVIGQELLTKEYQSVNYLDLIVKGQPGVYIVEIQTADKTSTLKIIKE